MSCKIDDRLPKEVGAKSLPLHPAIKTPWEKLISFHDAYHYACRHHAVIGAVYQEVLRILVPDYDERCTLMCKTDVGVKNYIFRQDGGSHRGICTATIIWPNLYASVLQGHGQYRRLPAQRYSVTTEMSAY